MAERRLLSSWYAETTMLQEGRPLSRHPIHGLAWLDDNVTLAVATSTSLFRTYFMQLRHAPTARHRLTYPDPFTNEEGYRVYRVAWSPDRRAHVSAGGYVVLEGTDIVATEGFLYVWEAPDF